MKFSKMHGIGNDYVVLDGRADGPDWSKLAREMCDRHFGVGSDGLLVVASSDRADTRMRMFNPDGSESEMCGNGIRCFAKYVYDRGLIAKKELKVETGNGVLDLAIDAPNGRAERVTVAMGAPEFRPERVPVVGSGERAFDVPVDGVGADVIVSCVSMGNPHAVMFLDGPVADFPLEQVGPRVEHHRLFPRRVNFEVVQVKSRGELDVRVWERGAGITLACGTGACGVVAVARTMGLIDERVRVNMPGGPLEIEWNGKGDVMMTGPATLVFEGEWGG
jgi:diaminopimelate epimerase